MISRIGLSIVITSVLAELSFGFIVHAVHAQEPEYPTRSIRLVVPYAPGGGTDVLARILSPRLSAAMGQSWVVENRSGAAGNVGAELVARAEPDGYTVMLALDSTLTTNPSLYKMRISIEKDLQPVTMLASADMLVLVHPSVPAKNLQEFVALAKKKPGAYNYASGGVGSSLHLATELLKTRTGIDIVHIPYKGGGPAAAAMLTGETQVQIGTVASTMGYISSGNLRPLASTGIVRSKLMPDLPTVAEAGYSGFEADLWFALLVPVATPKYIVTRIRDEVIKALQNTDVQSSLARHGMTPVTSTPAELAARIKKETGVWAAIIKDLGIRAE